jgi:hypothetical protein
MSILWTIIIGLIAGALARLIVPGTEPSRRTSARRWAGTSRENPPA